MQNIYTVTEKEYRELEQISSILLYINEIADDSNDDEHYDKNDVKRTLESVIKWSKKAEDTLSAILHGCYDHEKHNLTKYEF